MTKQAEQEAENAIKLLLNYIGEDTEREGIKDTPARIIKSYKELFSGYQQDPGQILKKNFQDISEYNSVVMLKSINFTSFCEHHMLPFTGFVDIAYLPDKSVIGVSKLARLVDIFSKRLQIQERMTAEIAKTLHINLKPKGVAVRVVASHSCMTARGILKDGSLLESYHYTGIYQTHAELKNEFLNMLKH